MFCKDTPFCLFLQESIDLIEHTMGVYDATKSLKMYYAIGEVAEMIGVTTATLRFWENEFPMVQPRKAGRNIRQYTKEDVETIKLIHNLVKVRGMKLAAAREAIMKNRKGVEKTSEIIDRLKNVRDELMAVKREIDSLE